MLEDFRIRIGYKVAKLFAGLGVSQNHPIDHLLEGPLAIFVTYCATEILGRNDGGSIHRPEIWKLNPALFENDLATLPVCLNDISALPRHFVIGMHSRLGINTFQAQSLPCLDSGLTWSIDDRL